MKLHFRKSHADAKAAPAVTLEVSRSHLTLATVERNTGTNESFVNCRRSAWRKEATALRSELGVQELSRAMKSLAAEEGWSNHQPLVLALSSDYCVTRVVAGDNEKVMQELANLEERSALYLSLGTGKKVWAQSFRPIDVKRRHAWMSVVNELNLMAITRAADQAGIKIQRIEHSLLSLCRAVGRMGKDRESPVLILDVGERGVDLGVCYRGELLLDFRPGGESTKEHVASIVVEHLKRLQRYCDRYFRFAQGKIRHIYLCGDPEETEAIYQQFAQCPALSAEILQPTALADGGWTFPNPGAMTTDQVAVLGAALLHESSSSQCLAPNLMETIERRNRGPLVREVLRAAWPIAAAVLVMVGLYGATAVEQMRCGQLETQQKELEAQAGRIKQMQLQIASADAQLKQGDKLRAQLFNPSYSQLVDVLSRCLPEGVWLETLKVDRDGNAIISGPSQTENGIYEFVGYLQKSRKLQNVVLEGTQPMRLAIGPVTRFEVRCKFNGRIENSNGRAENDRNDVMAIR